MVKYYLVLYFGIQSVREIHKEGQWEAYEEWRILWVILQKQFQIF